MILRPALPHWPAGGAMKAAGLMCNPSGESYSGAPVYIGRTLLVKPRIGVGYDGDCGRPLPAVSWVERVHSLNRAPRHPLRSAPPITPTPVLYCAWTERLWRWSKTESPRSAERSSQFCATSD